MRPYPDVSETLTRDELARPFLVSDVDPMMAAPLPRRTRNHVEVDGDRWAEIDIETGEILAEGSIGEMA